jgi:phospholipid/cholesterol/gamma-HCH transport system ATP-binding protein
MIKKNEVKKIGNKSKSVAGKIISKMLNKASVVDRNPDHLSRPKIIVEGLCKSFGKKVILDKLDLEVNQNESLVVFGGSGSGKSVLIKTIIGLLQSDAGSIKLDGEEISDLSNSARSNMMSRFGFLFQGGALFDSLRVWENVAFALLHGKKMSIPEAKAVSLAKLHSVGLNEDVLNLFPSELSGGMQKRVALARAIATNPEVIFFDEPTTGLDPIMANVINDLIVKVREEVGATTITITHDINSARAIANRVAMLYQGKIIWVGDVKDMDNSGNPVFEQFINGRITGPIKVDV